MNLTETIETSLAAANLPETDQAAAEIARILGMQIETAVNKRDTKTVGDLSTKLIATLTALGMTQAGRAVKTKIEGGAANDTTDTAASTFAKLRSSFN